MCAILKDNFVQVSSITSQHVIMHQSNSYIDLFQGYIKQWSLKFLVRSLHANEFLLSKKSCSLIVIMLFYCEKVVQSHTSNHTGFASVKYVAFMYLHYSTAYSCSYYTQIVPHLIANWVM